MLGGWVSLVYKYISKNKSKILFYIFVVAAMCIITIPFKLGVYISIFLVTLYKLLFKKVIDHFKTGNLKFDVKDYIIYLLMFIMTLFMVFIASALHSILPYFVEALLATM